MCIPILGDHAAVVVAAGQACPVAGLLKEGERVAVPVPGPVQPLPTLADHAELVAP